MLGVLPKRTNDSEEDYRAEAAQRIKELDEAADPNSDSRFPIALTPHADLDTVLSALMVNFGLRPGLFLDYPALTINTNLIQVKRQFNLGKNPS